MAMWVILQALPALLLVFQLQTLHGIAVANKLVVVVMKSSWSLLIHHS